MSKFRCERNRNYVVMCNYHLQDKNLSLKAKGLLSLMLSLPDDWNFSVRGLQWVCKEGISSIGSALRELEEAGYLSRKILRSHGKIVDTEYIIREKPHLGETPPEPEKTHSPEDDSPCPENMDTVCRDPESDAQLNINKQNINKQSINKDLNINSFQFFQEYTDCMETPEEANRIETISANEFELYNQVVQSNIEYDKLIQNHPHDAEIIQEIKELIVETICSNRAYTHIAKADYPHEIVRSRFLKLTADHVEFVLTCLNKNVTKVRNIKQYLLAVLFNAPMTMNNYFSLLLNHDLSGDSDISCEETAAFG